jgi:Uma2 family endonuclease
MMEVYRFLPEGTLAELIDNRLYMSPSPIFNHQKTIQEIFRKLCVEVLDSNKGEVIIAPFDVYLDETSNAVQPDIIVVLNQSSQIIDPRGHIHGVPDILIEVLSPNNKDHDQVLKKSLYERFGVKEYWIIDPETRLTLVYEWAKNGYSLAAEDTGLIRSRLLATTLAF